MQALHKRKKTVWIWGIVLIAVVFFLWNPAGVGQHTKGFVHAAFAPLLYHTAQFGTTISRTVRAIIHLPSLGHDLAVAEDEVSLLTARLAQYEDVLSENNRLREIINLPLLTEGNMLAADVIMRDFMSGNWALINRGSNDLVRVGDLAISAEGILIGTVFEVTPRSAYVRLSTDEKSTFRVIKSGTTSSAVAHGSHGTVLRVEDIDTEVPVQPGDVFLYSNTDSVDIATYILSVGTVQDVTMTDDQLSQTARLVPLYDASTMTHLFILHHEQS